MMVKSEETGEKTELKKGPWSKEEDEILINYINNNGHLNWRSLPKKAGLLRCGKSCRLRWMNYLRPDIRRGNFTYEEEATIIKLHQALGNRWSAIAARLPGRTDNEIKNIWNTRLKKRLDKGYDGPSKEVGSGIDESNGAASFIGFAAPPGPYPAAANFHANSSSTTTAMSNDNPAPNNNITSAAQGDPLDTLELLEGSDYYFPVYNNASMINAFTAAQIGGEEAGVFDFNYGAPPPSLNPAKNEDGGMNLSISFWQDLLNTANNELP